MRCASARPSASPLMTAALEARLTIECQYLCEGAPVWAQAAGSRATDVFGQRAHVVDGEVLDHAAQQTRKRRPGRAPRRRPGGRRRRAACRLPPSCSFSHAWTTISRRWSSSTASRPTKPGDDAHPSRCGETAVQKGVHRSSSRASRSAIAAMPSHTVSAVISVGDGRFRRSATIAATGRSIVMHRYTDRRNKELPIMNSRRSLKLIRETLRTFVARAPGRVVGGSLVTVTDPITAPPTDRDRRRDAPHRHQLLLRQPLTALPRPAPRASRRLQRR
jgi:hypothetical protein